MIEIIKIKRKGLFIRMSEKDALKLIQSLTTQMIEKSPNSGRWEPITKEGKEFTIAVVPEDRI